MKTVYWKILGAVALSGMLFALPAWAEEAGEMPQTQPAQCGSDLSYGDDDPLAGVLNAQRGCCSWHGGVSGRCYQGRVVCNDGTLSPSCRCQSSETGLQTAS